tara:strand:+ start:4106 stop:4216 length:111 start_codon:yes stop_codon:yes gene_type:complete
MFLGTTDFTDGTDFKIIVALINEPFKTQRFFSKINE